MMSMSVQEQGTATLFKFVDNTILSGNSVSSSSSSSSTTSSTSSSSSSGNGGSENVKEEPSMISLVTLDPPLASSYFRNNRSTKQKSLRCFPACCPKGHIQGGFCGDALVARINLKTTSSIDNYRFIAELRPSGSPNVSQHESIPREEVLKQLRTKNDMCAFIGGQIYEAEATVIARDGDNIEIDLSFNTYKCSWDYMWKSNRWCGAEVTHVINIIVLEDTQGDDFIVKSECVSTPFLVISSHKKIQRNKTLKKAKDDKDAVYGSISNPAVAMKKKQIKRGRPAAIEYGSSGISYDESSQATTSASESGSVSNPPKKRKYTKRAKPTVLSTAQSEIDKQIDEEQASTPPFPLLYTHKNDPSDEYGPFNLSQDPDTIYLLNCINDDDYTDYESISCSEEAFTPGGSSPYCSDTSSTARGTSAELTTGPTSSTVGPLDTRKSISIFDSDLMAFHRSDSYVPVKSCLTDFEEAAGVDREVEGAGVSEVDMWAQMQAFLLPGEGTDTMATWMDTLVETYNETYNTAHHDSSRSSATNVHCDSIVNGVTTCVSSGGSSTGFQVEEEGPTYDYCSPINVRSLSDLSTVSDISSSATRDLRSGFCEHCSPATREGAAMEGDKKGSKHRRGRGRKGGDRDCSDPSSIKWCLWCEWL